MTEIYFCPVCGQELVGELPCQTCSVRTRRAVVQKELEERREVFQRQAPVSEDLQHFLGHNGIRGEAREKALEMMGALLGAGLHLIDAFPMWVCYDSERGERIFADVFFELGKARLLWKDIGSKETTETVLELCSGAGVSAHFPFAYKEPTNGQKREAKLQDWRGRRPWR